MGGAMTPHVCILDFSSGNVGSVKNLFHTLTDRVSVSNDPAVLRAATHLVLPGVGSFGAAMERIRAHIPLDVLKQEIFEARKPFLGICVGLQVLANKGFEFGEYDGLGWIPGVVRRMETGSLPLPHIGWNDITVCRESPLLAGLMPHPDFYFVHSYAYIPVDPADVIATCTYGVEFPCVLGKGNIIGVQFHPEKSQKAGKLVIQNFLGMEAA
jgi:imidazole glycerol-phosphate synthase subunit HisH